MAEIEDLSADPARLKMDPAGLQRAEAVVRRGLEAGAYPAATYIVLRGGRIAGSGALGSIQSSGRPTIAANIHTVFDMASLTKPVTAVMLLQSAERGDLHLGMRVQDIVPEAAETAVGPLTLFQLATHTSGLPPWKPLYKSELKSAVAEILATELEAQPGARYAYSDLSYILLGEILQRSTGIPLDRLAQQRIFEPLEMRRTGFCPPAAMRDHIAATANCPWREGETLVGEVHDANAHSMSGVSGHAGLFSSANDMARFAVALFQPDEVSQRGIPPLLRPQTRRLAITRQTDPAVGGHSIGWFTVPNAMLPRGDLLSELTVGHTGFTGTMALHDPACGLTILLLTNRVCSAADGGAISRLRRLFANAVAGAVDAGGTQLR